MSDTLWSGMSAGKLYLTSGQFTSTIKDSQSIVAVDTQIVGISKDISNIPWIGSQADKLYLQSGKFTSTLKTSQAIGAVDTEPQGISYDANGNTPWVGGQADKCYLTSGQFTSTIKTSNATDPPDKTPTGISAIEDGDTPFTGTNVDKLVLFSGQFTSTIKDSQYVGSIDTAPHDISWDGTNTPWVGYTDLKLYLQSGQFTSTLKTSQSVAAVDHTPYGIESDDSGSRLGIWVPPSGVTATSGHTKVTITFDSLEGATSYNLYWGTSSGVTKITGTKMENITSGYEWVPPSGYSTGVPYYFVVTGYNVTDGETAISTEANGTPYFLDLSAEQDLSVQIYSVVRQPSTGYYIAACASGKVFRSIDGGNNWSEVSTTDSTPLHDTCVTENGCIFVTTNGGRVYYSSDNGASFSQAVVNSWRGVGGDSAYGIDSSGDRIYVVGDMQPGFDPAVFYSDDNGGTWTSMGALGTLAAGGILLRIDVIDQTEMYVTTYTDNKIFKYANSAWTDISDIARAKPILLAGENLYNGNNSGDKLRVSDDGGVTWSDHTGAAMSITTAVNEIHFDSSSNNLYIAVNSVNGRIYITNEDGTPFENGYIFTGETNVETISLDFENAIIVAGAGSTIYRGNLPVIPGQVIGLSAIPLTSATNQISWNSISGASTYNLYWSYYPGVTKTDNVIEGISSVTYDHIGLESGTTYYYAVAASGALGEGDLSDEDDATPPYDTAEFKNMLWHLLPKGRFWQK